MRRENAEARIRLGRASGNREVVIFVIVLIFASVVIHAADATQPGKSAEFNSGRCPETRGPGARAFFGTQFRSKFAPAQ
ncbi:MAG: hypothetical protein ACI915_002603 [Gammaproteobacteria bacterium]|jgi:hypothetical protein